MCSLKHDNVVIFSRRQRRWQRQRQHSTPCFAIYMLYLVQPIYIYLVVSGTRKHATQFSVFFLAFRFFCFVLFFFFLLLRLCFGNEPSSWNEYQRISNDVEWQVKKIKKKRNRPAIILTDLAVGSIILVSLSTTHTTASGPHLNVQSTKLHFYWLWIDRRDKCCGRMGKQGIKINTCNWTRSQ